MSTHTHRLLIHTVVALFGVSADNAAIASLPDDEQDLAQSVQACLSEINDRADYSTASRVRHWVHDIRQTRRTRMRIRIETTVYARHSGEAREEYVTSCLIAGPDHVLDFRISTKHGDRSSETWFGDGDPGCYSNAGFAAGAPARIAGDPPRSSQQL